MTSLNTSHLSQTHRLGRSLQSKTLTKEEPLPVTSEGVWTFSVYLWGFFSAFCFFYFSTNQSALMSLCNVNQTNISKGKKKQQITSHQWRNRLHWTVWPIDLCEGRIKEQLLGHRSSQLSSVWRPQRAKSLRLNLSFSPAAGSGIWQCVSGMGVSAPLLLGLFWAYIITSQAHSSSSVILMTTVWCFTCCVIRWKVSGIAKKGQNDQDLTCFLRKILPYRLFCNTLEED